jgi:hypothetical protein
MLRWRKEKRREKGSNAQELGNFVREKSEPMY